MRLNSKKILGISITTNVKEEILEYFKKCLENTGKTGVKSLTIVTPNPEQVVLAQKNPHFAEFLNRADVAIPDGIGVVWASRILNPIVHISRITGVELIEELVGLAAKQGYRIGLIGGRGGVAVRALECLEKKHSGLRGWAIDGPELKIQSTNQLINQLTNGKENVEQEINQIADKIRKSGIQIVFVGLGAPKQEYFIEKLKVQMAKLKQEKTVVFMSVGGSFDEISGRLPMPPKFIDRYGLKWLWRLSLEPWRWKRQLALLEFIWLVLKEKLIS